MNFVSADLSNWSVEAGAKEVTETADNPNPTKSLCPTILRRSRSQTKAAVAAAGESSTATASNYQLPMMSMPDYPLPLAPEESPICKLCSSKSSYPGLMFVFPPVLYLISTV